MKQSNEIGNKLVDKAWEKMNLSLDVALPQKSNYKPKLWYFFLILGLVCIGLGLFWYVSSLDEDIYIDHKKHIASNASNTQRSEETHNNLDKVVCNAETFENEKTQETAPKNDVSSKMKWNDSIMPSYSTKAVEKSNKIDHFNDNAKLDKSHIDSEINDLNREGMMMSDDKPEDIAEVTIDQNFTKPSEGLLRSFPSLSVIALSKLEFLQAEINKPALVLSSSAPSHFTGIANLSYAAGRSFSGLSLNLGLVKSINNKSGIGVLMGLSYYKDTADPTDAFRDSDTPELETFGFIEQEQLFNDYLKEVVQLSFGAQYFHYLTNRTLFSIGVGVKQNIFSRFRDFHADFGSIMSSDTEIEVNGTTQLDITAPQISNKTIPFLRVGLDYSIYKTWHIHLGYDYHLKEMFDLVERPKSTNSFNLGISKTF